MLETEPRLGWPRVHAACDYRKPLRFDDLVEIHLLVSAKKSKSLSYLFRFRKLGEKPEPVAVGALTIVCVVHGPDGTMSATPIPAAIADKIQVAPAKLLT